MVLFFLGVAVFQLIPASSQCRVCSAITREPTMAVQDQNPKVELTRAREKFDRAQKQLEVIKGLHRKGSANDHALRVADTRRKVALLEYSSLLDPAKAEKNLILKAEVIFQFRSEEFEVAKVLYQKGSMSKVGYQRALSARDVARSNLAAVKSATETQRKIQVIQAAKSKYEFAKKELEVAKRLFESSSISRQTMDRVTSNFKIAAAELEAGKESLGARATVVTQ